MVEAKEYIQRESGVEPGVGYELTFSEMGESEKSLNRRSGKVGFRTSMTEFFRAAKQRG